MGHGSAVNPSTGEKLPRTTEDDTAKLTYRVADNENATATIAAGIAEACNRKIGRTDSGGTGNEGSATPTH